MINAIFKSLVFFKYALLYGTTMLLSAQTPQREPAGLERDRRQATYVWSFSTINREITVLTRQFTEDFELALNEVDKFKILERRSLDRLLYQRNKEIALTSATEISAEAKQAFTQLGGADFVIFGEVFDDVDGGEVSIRVSAQNWSGVQIGIAKISINRGYKSAGAERQKAMAALATQLAAGLPGPPGLRPKGQTDSRDRKAVVSTSQSSRPIPSVDFEGFTFSLLSCRRSGGVLTCELQLTRNRTDRNLSLRLGPRTALTYGKLTHIVDDENNLYDANYISIANSGTARGMVYASIVAGTVSKITIQFSNVPIDLKRIAKLEICGELDRVMFGTSGREFHVRFDDISL